MKRNRMKKCNRMKLHSEIRFGFAAPAALLAAAFSGGAIAQEAAPAAEPTELESIEVTGSRIPRDEFGSSSPISSFNRDDFDKSGVISVDEFLKEIPAFTGFQLNTSTNNGGDGQKKVDMRGLGFNRTLVLINGRRQIGDINGDGAVDLNTIPDALIERIEVLKDGASTIYGTDALSGVVNVILRDNFDGMELRTTYTAGTEDGQAESKGLSFVGGTSSGRGNFLMGINYNEQAEMYQAERDWALYDLFAQLDANGNFVAVRSGSSNGRTMRVDHDQDGGVVTPRLNRVFDTNAADAVGLPGAARAYAPATDAYNFAPVNAMITPNEHWQLSALGNTEFLNRFTGYFEGLYTRRTSHQRLAADASFSVTNVNTPNNGVRNNAFVPASNPFNPYGDFADPTDNPEGVTGIDIDRINRRFVESGGRIFVQGSDTFRLAFGLKGELIEGKNLFWDVSYTLAQNEVINETLNYGRFDRWAIAVDPAACAADTACTAAGGVLNPFAEYGSITPGQMAYLSTGSLKDVLTADMNTLAVNLNGSFLALPGGPLGWAVGIERRRESGNFSPDEFSAEGLTTGGASDPQSGDFEVKEFYGEVLLPVLDMLTFDVSARAFDYNTSAGSDMIYKLGVDFAPIDSLRIRAGYGTGFRAPNISELNQDQSTTFPIVEPLCEFGDRRLAAGDMTQTAYDNCVAMGLDMSDASADIIGGAWQSAYTFLAPTQPLKPEESTNMHLGVVFTPEFVKGLSLSVDYWSIEIENLISVPDINALSRKCLNSLNMTDASCTAFVSGEVYDQGVPSDATAEFGNLGTIKTAGLDFNAFYEASLQNPFLKGYHLQWGATFVDTYETDFDLSGKTELAGTANGFAVYPEWRWNVEAGVDGAAGWTAAWQMRYIGETEDALREPYLTDDAKAEAMMYHDLVGSYVLSGVTLTGGINNVTDEDPPFFHSAFNAETEPGMYDVVGRVFFMGVKVAF